MEIERIIEQLRAERSRIDQAIAALESSGSTQALRSGKAPRIGKKRGRRSMSMAERKKLSKAMKARWAERKAKASGKSKA